MKMDDKGFIIKLKRVGGRKKSGGSTADFQSYRKSSEGAGDNEDVVEAGNVVIEEEQVPQEPPKPIDDKSQSVPY